MADPITRTQLTYIRGLLKGIEEEKFKEFKRQLKILQETPVEELTKDEAYKLISRMVTESTEETVRKALAAAVKEEREE